MSLSGHCTKSVYSNYSRKSIYDVKSLLDHDNVTTTQLYASHRKNAKRNIIKNFELDDEY